MKDFDWVIGKSFGELTILSYTAPLKELRHQRKCICQCSCGKQVEKRLSRVLGDEVKSCGHLRSQAGKEFSSNLDHKKAYEVRTSKDKPMSNSHTGIRNIAKAENGDGYRVYISRHGKHYRKRAKTLAEALLVKKELIRQAEEEFGMEILRGMNAHLQASRCQVFTHLQDTFFYLGSILSM